MRALVIYAHPREDSFAAAVRDVVLARLEASGVEVRLRDLYGEAFVPALSAQEHRVYEDPAQNQHHVARDVADLRWCDTLVFVYPTWWYGLPAILKGWLDRALVPEVAFLMPKVEGETIRPGLTHITRLGVFTTYGASRLLTFYVGSPGKRTLLRGLRLILAPRVLTVFATHYLMDSSTAESRARHLVRVARKMDRLVGVRPSPVAGLQERSA